MYKILNSLIAAGNYKLSEMQYKIKKMYIMGDLSEEEMNTLMTKASEKISAAAERPETLVMIQTLMNEIKDLKHRVESLEAPKTEPETPEVETPEEEITYSAWEPWNGIDDKYQPGAIVMHNGELWQNIHDTQNVWEPGAPGTTNLWIKYEA